jgi:hypothetical protein
MRKLWRVMRRVLKWSGITVFGLLALALLLFAAAFIINAHDEQLSPQARALLTPPPNPYKPAGNIFLALLGADAPPGESIIAAGLTKVSSYNQRVDALMRNPGLAAQEAFLLPPENPQRLAFKGDCGFVKPLQESLWQTIPPHREQVEKLLADNRELYQRYLALHEMHGYYETARPSWLVPSMPWPVCERKVFLAEYVLRARSRDLTQRHQALGDLQDDVRLWRRVFAGEGALVSKMLSVAYLQQDYLLLADTIADPQVPIPVREQDADSVVPRFDLRDWDLGRAFAAELRVSSSVVKQTHELSRSAWAADGEPRGAVRRELARLYNRVGGPEPAAAVVSLPTGLSAWTLLLTYNSGGKVLATIGDASYAEHPPGVWDAAAVQRLVRLGYEIRRQKIAADAIPTFLSEHPEWSTHPADGRPFLWDARTGELRIQTLAKQPPDRRFSAPVWQAATTN